MLLEYFSLEITAEGELVSIPLLLKGYTPSMGKLSSFLLRIGPNVRVSPIFLVSLQHFHGRLYVIDYSFLHNIILLFPPKTNLHSFP